MKINYSSVTVGLTLFIIMTGIYIAYEILTPERKLPIYTPADLNQKLVDPSMKNKSGKHRIKDFSFTNQLGEVVTQETFQNTVYVTDFFFTTCQSICPKMSSQLKRVQDSYEKRADVKILSHTVMPEVDSVPLLLSYSLEQGAISGKWHFVTGHRAAIYDMARTSYFACEDPGLGDAHDFVHTENFVLIDKEKRIRGFYDGTSAEEVSQLIADISLLLHEEE